jgi:hypothetical protein
VRAARVVASGLATGAVAIAACGVAPGHHPPQPRPDPVSEAQAKHEYPSPPAPSERVAGASASPISAVAAFVGAYINWDAVSVSADMRQLAARSIDQARAATELAAGETAGDYELQRGGVANSGAIEAITPLSGHAGKYVVVTKELTTATATTVYQGLQPAWHVAIATVAEVSAGQWVVSGWQPQS